MSNLGNADVALSNLGVKGHLGEGGCVGLSITTCLHNTEGLRELRSIEIKYNSVMFTGGSDVYDVSKVLD